jgi:hypothetical protein
LLELVKCAGFVLYDAFFDYTTGKNGEFNSDKLWGELNIFCVFYLLVKKSVLKIGLGIIIAVWGALSC